MCTCSLQSKIPIIKRSFIQDQRTNRKKYVGPVDVQYSAKVRKRVHRSSLPEVRALKAKKKEGDDSREAEAK